MSIEIFADFSIRHLDPTPFDFPSPYTERAPEGEVIKTQGIDLMVYNYIGIYHK
jgi:hypothetical protein